MISIQIVPRIGQDAYKLLRYKVTHEARTWSWTNKAKTRLKHAQLKHGYIEVGSADAIVVAHIHPNEPSDAFFLLEKFIGRLTAWFSEDIVAINVQFISEEKARKKK
jgi:hypothetical protein